MGEERFSTEQVRLIGPIVDRLVTMMGAARDAFNRHSRPRVEELRSLQALTARAIHDVGTELKSLIAQEIRRRTAGRRSSPRYPRPPGDHRG